MRYLSVVLSLLIVPSVAAAQGKLTPRPLDAVSIDTFAVAVEGSALVRSMVARLESSNVIVHIESSSPMPFGIGGFTRFVTSRGGYRYVRITLNPQLALRARSAILGHELKHACEIADSTAGDPQSIRKLFETAGHYHGGYYDTTAAIRTGRQVWNELRVNQPLQAEPVVKFDH